MHALVELMDYAFEFGEARAFSAILGPVRLDEQNHYSSKSGTNSPQVRGTSSRS